MDDCGVVWNDCDTKNWSEIHLRFTQKITNLYLSNYPLSEYQKFLLRIIYRLRNQEYSWRIISRYLNESGLKSSRGKQFTPNLVSQIIKKNQIRKKRRQNNYEVKLSNFYYEFKWKLFLKSLRKIVNNSEVYKRVLTFYNNNCEFIRKY